MKSIEGQYRDIGKTRKLHHKMSASKLCPNSRRSRAEAGCQRNDTKDKCMALTRLIDGSEERCGIIICNASISAL
jgi:hypothetical protein